MKKLITIMAVFVTTLTLGVSVVFAANTFNVTLVTKDQYLENMDSVETIDTKEKTVIPADKSLIMSYDTLYIVMKHDFSYPGFSVGADYFPEVKIKELVDIYPITNPDSASIDKDEFRNIYKVVLTTSDEESLFKAVSLLEKRNDVKSVSLDVKNDVVYETLSRYMEAEMFYGFNNDLAVVLKGDSNSDKSVNRADYTLVSKYFAGQSVTPDKDSTDVNGDGDVNRKDYLICAKYFSGKEVSGFGKRIYKENVSEEFLNYFKNNGLYKEITENGITYRNIRVGGMHPSVAMKENNNGYIVDTAEEFANIINNSSIYDVSCIGALKQIYNEKYFENKSLVFSVGQVDAFESISDENAVISGGAVDVYVDDDVASGTVLEISSTQTKDAMISDDLYDIVRLVEINKEDATLPVNWNIKAVSTSSNGEKKEDTIHIKIQNR